MRAVLLFVTVALLSPGAVPASAQDRCEDLWLRRNGIYKAAGYCFRTPRAVAAFGNAGCEHDDLDSVPLSSAERRAVAAILGEERALRCPR